VNPLTLESDNVKVMTVGKKTFYDGGGGGDKHNVVVKRLIRHEVVLGSGGIAPRILNLGTRSSWVVSFTIQPLYTQAKSPRYPLDRRLGGLQSQSGRGGEGKRPVIVSAGKWITVFQPLAQCGSHTPSVVTESHESECSVTFIRLHPHCNGRGDAGS
jgi:hypothetical protein